MKFLLFCVSALLFVCISFFSCKQRNANSQVLVNQNPAPLHGAIVFIGHESQAEFLKNIMLPSLSKNGVDIVELYIDDSGDFSASSKESTVNIPYHDVGDIIKNAKWNIALIGSKSVANDDIRNAWSAAKETSIGAGKKNLIPVTIEKVSSDLIPLYIRSLTGVDMTGSPDMQNRSLDRLTKVLKSK